MKDTSQSFEHFGEAVAVGDFNGDGYVDVAAGVPGERTLGIAMGAVHVIYAHANGGIKIPPSDILISISSPGVPGTMAEDDEFGAALATGDFNGDGKDDLAVGIPQRDFAGIADSGEVRVFYGQAGGLDTTTSVFFRQGHVGTGTTIGKDEYFGRALATGWCFSSKPFKNSIK